jgi:signal transduction histidine kinase
MRATFQAMKAIRRALLADPGLLLDAGLAILGVGLTALAAWDPTRLIGSPIAGPPWLRAALPLLIGVPMVLRRRAPLIMWLTVWTGIALQDLVTQDLPQGLEFMFVLFTGAYSLAAYSGLRRAVVGLAVTAPLMVLTSRQGGLLAFPGHPGGTSGVRVSFSFVQILAFWLIGVFVHARRQAAALAAGNQALQRQAEEAVAVERTRIARELHDIVAHHLSVIVLQAAGARASGRPADATLEKIERSGRQALTETRRLLGVLRDPGDEDEPAPQPGINDLAKLANTVRAAGLPVTLAIHGDHTALPTAVDVSAYRIVQEALTNVVKHAGPAHADVTIDCSHTAVTVEITDNGDGHAAHGPRAGGHGLTGMRERVAVFGGDLRAGPQPGGGFTVRARLPFADQAS